MPAEHGREAANDAPADAGHVGTIAYGGGMAAVPLSASASRRSPARIRAHARARWSRSCVLGMLPAQVAFVGDGPVGDLHGKVELALHGEVGGRAIAAGGEVSAIAAEVHRP